MSQVSRFLPNSLIRWLKILLRPSSVAVLPGSISYADDGFATIHNASFGLEPRFASAYQSGLRTQSWSNVEWRAHVIAWAAQYAVSLDGDFVECGVNRGGYSKMIVDYLNFSKLDKKFYLLDTFSGLVPDYVSTEEKQRGILNAYHYDECFRAVSETFASVPNVVLVRGPVPDTLPQVTSSAIAFVSIDMNCIEPEIAAANAFWDRIVPGGIVVLDDYGHPLHIGQKEAFDRFAREKNVTILSLPTAQAIIVKPH
jgi:O-methyltransferase